MDKIIACVVDVFPECDPAALTSESRLREVPGWDSMNGVNLLMALEAAFSVSLADDVLTGNEQLADVDALIRSRLVEV
jgi:acyl carrier protein